MSKNKGRGRAALTFNIEAIGFSKGERLPDVVLKPPPPFPDTDYKPAPLKTGDDEDYMLALKQEFRETMRRMPYFIDKEKNQEIERYSRRYQKDFKQEGIEWIPDWRRLPKEMMPRRRPQKGPKSKKAKPSREVTALTGTTDVLKKIEELEKKGDGEKSDEETEERGVKEKRKEDDDDEDGAEPEEYDEEEYEEENDYIASYFEDGDDFGAESDDNMDEATY
ncbi:DNA-directed RNA polymerase III subunit RPC7 isoform X2 [Ornithorhynchus anatinus]|uniref:RNA polymerase III subunit G n=1 Tax=Ornithorhynchus anatinus TaxID=9258 RepID=A0A6I8NKG4_ORNAN|nr:DNA-directed RNA polymerase III subunit RPC7 isoform X2 [Ornithorhynchus anatinus]